MARLLAALAALATAAAWVPLRPAGLRALPKTKASNVGLASDLKQASDWRSACENQGVVSFYDFGAAER